MRVYAVGQLALQSVDLIEDFDGHCYNIKIEKSHWSSSRTAEHKVNMIAA